MTIVAHRLCIARSSHIFYTDINAGRQSHVPLMVVFMLKTDPDTHFQCNYKLFHWVTRWIRHMRRERSRLTANSIGTLCTRNGKDMFEIFSLRGPEFELFIRYLRREVFSVCYFAFGWRPGGTVPQLHTSNIWSIETTPPDRKKLVNFCSSTFNAKTRSFRGTKLLNNVELRN